MYGFAAKKNTETDKLYIGRSLYGEHSLEVELDGICMQDIMWSGARTLIEPTIYSADWLNSTGGQTIWDFSFHIFALCMLFIAHIHTATAKPHDEQHARKITTT